jgi:hypothetical protein
VQSKEFVLAGNRRNDLIQDCMKIYKENGYDQVSIGHIEVSVDYGQYQWVNPPAQLGNNFTGPSSACLAMGELVPESRP